MKQNIYLLLMLLLLLGFTPVSAEPRRTTLSGRLIESETQSPVGYATVSLSFHKHVISAAAADADGRFRVSVPRAGQYTLTVSMVGYATLEREVNLPNEGLSLGDVRLTQGVEVDQVVVEVQKPLVIADAEKMTYSVEDDPQSSGSTLEEIIRKVPQLSLDGDGNVMLNGQSNFKVLVNGHNSAAFSSNFTDLIRSMPADQISRIEVITNPSMKYDAEGVGGILNLVTSKKKREFGYNGSLSANTRISESGPGWYSSGNLSMQTDKFAFGARGWIYTGDWDYLNLSRQENFNSENRYKHSEGKGTGEYTGGGLNLDMSYQPDTLNLLTFSAQLWLNNGKDKGIYNQWTQNEALEELSRFTQDSHSKNESLGTSLGLNYEHNFGRKGHAITLSEEFGLTPSDNWDTQNYTGEYAYFQEQISKNHTTSNTLQLDYTNPLNDHHTIEAGLKHIYRKSTSPMSSFLTQNGATEPELGPYSDMNYRQHILAAYMGYGFTLEKWSVRAGARLERTWNDAEAEDQDNKPYSFENRQFNFIPYLSFTYTPAKSHTLSLSYTQRLQRPDIGMLSPGVDIQSPIELSYGNPNLEAAINHAFNLQYSHFTAKWSIMAGVNYFLSDNTMSSFSTTDSEGVRTTTYSNDVHMRSVGFNTSLSLRPSTKFSLALSLKGSYDQYDFAAQEIDNDRFSFSQNLNMDIALWKGARFVTGEGYNTGYNSLGSHSRGYYYYYFSLKQQFLKNKLTLSIGASNPFNRYREYENLYESPTHTSWSLSRSPSRRFSFGLTWRFGKHGVRVKSTAHQIKNDDIQSSSQGEQGGGGMIQGM